MATYYPPPSFYFSASVAGISGAGARDSVDCNFQEVSGIDVEFGVEEVSEGGGYTYRLPKQAKYPPLVMKRGVVTTTSALAKWVSTTLTGNLAAPIVPQSVVVNLFGSAGDIVMSWTFFNAFPLKWTTSSMNSTSNEVFTESLEFSYSYFTRTIPTWTD